jgi:phasin family protein
MSKPAPGSIFEIDFFKAMDPSKIMSDFKMPGFNLAPLFTVQRKNVEAMTALNQAAFDNFQAMMTRQAEMVRQSFDDASRIASSMMAAQNPQDKVMMQAEASKAAMEKCMANAREVTEAMSRYNTQAIETVSSRMRESLEELRGVVGENRDAA